MHIFAKNRDSSIFLLVFYLTNFRQIKILIRYFSSGISKLGSIVGYNVKTCYDIEWISKTFKYSKHHFETLHWINFKPILLWKIPDVAISKQHTVKRKMKGINWLYLFWVRKKFSSWMTLAITTYLLMVTGHLYPNVVMDAKKQMFIFRDNER